MQMIAPMKQGPHSETSKAVTTTVMDGAMRWNLRQPVRTLPNGKILILMVLVIIGETLLGTQHAMPITSA